MNEEMLNNIPLVCLISVVRIQLVISLCINDMKWTEHEP